jgi:hypothetical protein
MMVKNKATIIQNKAMTAQNKAMMVQKKAMTAQNKAMMVKNKATIAQNKGMLNNYKAIKLKAETRPLGSVFFVGFTRSFTLAFLPC